MKIVMPRGDLRLVKFSVTDSKGESMAEVPFSEIFVTFKLMSRPNEFLFQKRLSNGDITKDENGDYHFRIEPSDTEELIQDNTYAFDIELVKDSEIKQTFYGTLELTKEVTFAVNEGLIDSADEGDSGE